MTSLLFVKWGFIAVVMIVLLRYLKRKFPVLPEFAWLASHANTLFW